MSGAVATAATGRVMVRRAFNEILRVPGAAIPGILAPAIFMTGAATVFGALSDLPGFPTTGSYLAFLLPVGMLQAAGFAGAATGVNLARDIEQGWFDRLRVAPAPRWMLVAGTIASAAARSLLPIGFTTAVAFVVGVDWPGLLPLLLSLALAVSFAAIAAGIAVTLALVFKTQSAAPLMQSSAFMLVLFSPSFAPQGLLAGWLQDVARYNPVTKLVEAARQPFVGGVEWAGTWPALVVLAAGLVLFGALAFSALNRMDD